MPGGRRNPVSFSSIVDQIHGAVEKAKANAHDVTSLTKGFAEHNIRFVDLEIQFIGASGIPKMDVVGSADPYFIAKIDDKISFVHINTLTPVWNEVWRVKNVPFLADLEVELLDKDDGAPHDDYIGKFKTTIRPGAKEIDSTPSTHPQPHIHPYVFDGPIRYSRHSSPTVGLLTNLNDARLYSTWKMYIRDVQIFLDAHELQHWNRNYKAAQNIFQGPTSIAVRSGIQAGHRMLYARSTRNGFGIVGSHEELFKIFKGNRPGETDESTQRIKPAVYTYILSKEDDSFRFSETGAAFFVDFASKHALHANCAEAVRYSGEFHLRPECGWEAFSDDTPDENVQWELVVDNNSGTYAPDPMILPDLKALLEYNFKEYGLNVIAYNQADPDLKQSREACRAYALEHRGVRQEELEPHAGDGEVTLSAQASVFGSGAK
ncbi:hypothetical protein PC9H_001708 [Pleurotus ostreatus]|uniref:C2 domain-containing protein n=2 Tax=Pleurotus ostreatus TaxID=5322 RepID=A0A067P1Z2_PLEO1|nr:uncharacterized protein PC9H_001708 [Pleurotus ostreatus]KAF7441358.1 hypothetical protein PC9H_001708 [Pleurotus ostreatus]KDQ34194.1 hypothetical protein PLEOSDRAFT_1061756 [Pleurotus ostreatus PC15]